MMAPVAWMLFYAWGRRRVRSIKWTKRSARACSGAALSPRAPKIRSRSGSPPNTIATNGAPPNAVGEADPAIEAAYEISYRAFVKDWFSVQPDVQWVRNHGNPAPNSKALLLGLRLDFAF